MTIVDKFVDSVSRPPSGTAADWFADEAEFRQLCGDANSLARSETSQDFAAEMVIKAKKDGLNTRLSIRQLEWLCRLAEWEVPKRRT